MVWTPNINKCWSIRLRVNTPLSTLNLFKQPGNWKNRQKVEIPLPPKTTITRGLNITCSQMPGNLFPSHKLKGNCTFTIWSTTVESNKAEEDSGSKLEGEEETESSAGEDAESSSGGGRADQLVGYIVYFDNAVKLYQRKNQNCFRCGSPDHLGKDCLKDLSKTTQKVSLNVRKRTTKKGSQAPQKPVVTQLASLDKAPRA